MIPDLFGPISEFLIEAELDIIAPGTINSKRQAICHQHGLISIERDQVSIFQKVENIRLTERGKEYLNSCENLRPAEIRVATYPAYIILSQLYKLTLDPTYPVDSPVEKFWPLWQRMGLVTENHLTPKGQEVVTLNCRRIIEAHVTPGYSRQYDFHRSLCAFLSNEDVNHLQAYPTAIKQQYYGKLLDGF